MMIRFLEEACLRWISKESRVSSDSDWGVSTAGHVGRAQTGLLLASRELTGSGKGAPSKQVSL